MLTEPTLMAELDKMNDVERPSFSNLRKAPAAIRNNNPGAAWWSKRAQKFGSFQYQKLNDGLKQGNQIAIFQDAIAGAAYMFDLLDRLYINMTVRAAITKWAGGNNVNSYLSVIRDRAGVDANFVITKDYIRDPDWAIPFAAAMAAHEAGIIIDKKLQDYPLDFQHWQRAHAEAFDKPAVPIATTYASKTTDVVTKKPVSVFTFLAGLPVVLSDSFGNLVEFASDTATQFMELSPVKTVATQIVDNQWLVGVVIVTVSGAVVVKKWREGEE